MAADLDLTAVRERLRALQRTLTATKDAGDEAAATVELDQTKVGRLSRMDAMQAQAMSQASQQRRELQLKNIAAAILRIDNDEYGWCLDCDEFIEPKRLDFDPAAALCLACAEKREQA